MKLTKGKISKLYNKNKQTLKKKANKRKTSNKSKTFRRKQKVNLARKSLKRFHYKKQKGGDDIPPKEITPNADTVSNENIETPVKADMNTNNEPIIDSSPLAGTAVLNVEDIKKTSVDGMAAPVAEEVMKAPATEEVEVVESPATEEVDVVQAPATEEVVETPATEEVVETPAEEVVQAPAEEVVETPVTEEVEVVEAPVAEEVVEAPVAEEVVETPATEEVVEAVEPLVSQTNTEKKADVPMKQEKNEELKAAINTVVDYISEKISENVSKNIASPSGENIQNGFESINKTVETMASDNAYEK